MSAGAALGVRASLRGRIQRANSLPAVPEVYQRLAELSQRPDVSTEQIAELISTDPALAGRLLRLVNSAFFGCSNQIPTVSRAVTLAGLQTLKQLVLTTSIMTAFSKVPEDLDPQGFWEHSLATASGVRSMARALGWPNLEELFVAGLLHDVGLLFHFQSLPDESRAVARAIQRDGMSLLEAERQIIGQTHAESGAQLLRHWKLPLRLVSMAAYHHEPERTQAFGAEIAVGQVADMLVRALGIGADGDERIERISNEVWRSLDLDLALLDHVAAELESELGDLRKVLSATGD